MSGLRFPDSDYATNEQARHLASGLQPKSSNLKDLIASVEGKVKGLKGDGGTADAIDAARLRQEIDGGKFSGLA